MIPQRFWLVRSCAIFLLLIHSLRLFAGPRVDVVIGDKAPALEKLAAEELASQLKRVYDAEVQIGSTTPANAEHVLFVGSPDTNSNMKAFADSWPSGDKKLTDQGHLLRSVTHNHKPALLIGGGSPVATYWAVAEYGHHLGIRSMLFGDLDPVHPPKWSLGGFNQIIEPMARVRGWYFENRGYEGSGAWSVDEYRRCLHQLAKLRFNQITIAIDVNQPYLHFEFNGIKRSSGFVLRREPILVSGDTAGRKAFGGLKVFDHPTIHMSDEYDVRRSAATAYLRSIMDAAVELGFSVNLHMHLGAMPREFAALWPEKDRKIPRDDPSFQFSIKDLESDQQAVGLMSSQIRAALETYPKTNGMIWVSNQPNEDTLLRQFSLQPGLLRRTDGSDAMVFLESVEVSDNVTVRLDKSLTSSTTAAPTKPILHLTLTKQLSNVLPLFDREFGQDVQGKLFRFGCDGYSLRHYGIGESDLPAYWLSRWSCRDLLTPEEACRELVTPVCGAEVHQRVWTALEAINSATKLLAKSPWIGRPVPSLIELDTEKGETPPLHWKEARNHYLMAMNEMYRANTRAREGGRSFTLYLARRFEFAFEYMLCMDALFNAKVAQRNGDRETQIAELEKAMESLNNALNAMAAVARSNSDRGLIAVLNEYGYRPLKKKLAEAEAAAK